eukprot:357166-Chlamydomonas_euryale.AAC.3
MAGASCPARQGARCGCACIKAKWVVAREPWHEVWRDMHRGAVVPPRKHASDRHSKDSKPCHTCEMA